VSALSNKHVVLGLLIERPGWGYEVQQRLDQRFGFLALSEKI
jgi:DNA-binding PadR family transcriptional regulator